MPQSASQQLQVGVDHQSDQLIEAGRGRPPQLLRRLRVVAHEQIDPQTAGIRMLQVPYNGVAPAIQDTIAGRTQVLLVSSAAMLPLTPNPSISTHMAAHWGPISAITSSTPSGSPMSEANVQREVL